MSRPRAWVSWSSGKDSARALEEVRRQGLAEVVGLLTTVTDAYDRVSMHGVRRRLLELQAEALGLPLIPVEIPGACSNAAYEARFLAALEAARRDGVTHLVFGDLFLEDVRRYRERLLTGTGLAPLFPLWHRPTDRLARAMVTSGLRAVVTCVDPRQLAPSFAGRFYDARFLDHLPASVDPCGERGEFHTFVFEGPMFRRPVPIEIGAVVERDGFVFCDVLERTGPGQERLA